jgi:hypothetical protein
MYENKLDNGNNTESLLQNYVNLEADGVLLCRR